MKTRRMILAAFLLLTGSTAALGQAPETKDFAVATPPLTDNWYVQFGLDMSLQNPYGYDFADVLPNGLSYGIDAAIGRWFTPGFGVRVKLNWENGLIENKRATWLAPFGDNGINHDKGGYLGFLGDAQFNLHNLLLGYDAGRRWNLIAYPRVGVVYNFGVSKGAPLLGVGIENTYRLNHRWSLYFDMAYQMTSSGFVGVVKNTGTGSNSNGYFDLNVGVQLELGNSGFRKTDDGGEYDSHAVATNTFWSNWFVQAGLDMTLQNPYGCNFAHTFPKGKTFGIDAALGKWFSPEIAVRGKVNWENSLIENKHLEWVAPVDEQGTNFKKGGYAVASIDVMLHAQNTLFGYDSERTWGLCPYLRAGLIHNFAIDSASPVVGVGIENTYRLNERLSLFADVDYQATTSESSAGLTGMEVSTGSNGFFDICVGVQFDLAKSKGKFRKL